MQPITEFQIRELFAEERQTPFLPRLDHVDWAVLDYFGWIHPSGHLGYMVTPIANDELRGIVLRRAISTTKRPRMEMCSWCNHVHKRNGTAMFSVVVKGSDERRTIGNRMCRNLDCSLRIRNLSSDPPSYMMETLHLESKVQRLQNAIYRFLYRANALYAT
ncbi:MAG: hypothetical protein ACJAX5_001550 [Patiriisocius sp.]|jgi:hypothetical protein